MTEKTPAWNRDDEMKPGRPPRPASEPKGSEGSSETKKTGVNPSTGEPQRSPPRPNQSASDERPQTQDVDSAGGAGGAH